MSATAQTAPRSLGEDLDRALDEALAEGGEPGRWMRLLEENPAADPLAAIAANRDRAEQMLRATGFQDLGHWLRDVDAWLDHLHRDPTAVMPAAATVLYATWTTLRDQVTRDLRRARRLARLPAEGGALIFAEGIERCIVLNYRFFQTDVPQVTFLDTVEHPNAAFDLWASVDAAAQQTREALKSMLVSGHKLLGHRGVLAHVDRREESTVFGPSIDTLLCADRLARDVFERLPPYGTWSPRRVLEVGTGSGFLAAGALRHLPDAHVTCVDISFAAVACTHKNMTIAAAGVDVDARATMISGRYNAELFAEPFDLVICNPPYIPTLPPEAPGETSDYLRAVGGLELLEQLMGDLPRLLTEDGRLLLMVNSMAVEQALARVPHGFRAERPLGDGGHSVIFEVEAVFNRPGWLAGLKATGHLRDRGRTLEHTLHPLWVARS